ESEKESAFKPYQDRLDWKAKERIQAEFARVDRKAQEEMDRRGDDHLAWLDSEMLEQALDVYDRHQPVWGQAFASQIALCLLGMNGSSKGAAKLASWWSDTSITKRNLAWRALAGNSIDIERETREALAGAKAAANDLTADNLINELGAASNWFEKVIDLSIKADAAVQATIVTSAYRWFDPRRLSLTLSMFAYLHQYMLALLPANALDRRLLSPMLGFIHARLGEVTIRLRMSDLAAAGQTANRNRVAGQVNSHIGRVRDTLMREFQNGGGGQFKQLRGGVLLAMIEGIVLGVKASKKDEGEKEYLEYQAAILITSAAGVELTAIGVASVASRYASTGVVGRGAAISLGGLRLGGGMLALAGGVYMVMLDVDDMASSFKSERRALGYAYLGRAVVSAGISILASVVSISYSAPLLRWVLGANSQWGALLFLENLAASRLIPLFLRLIGMGTLVTLALSIVIMLLTPEEMEEWCLHSCFGKRMPGSFFKAYKDQKTELEKLYQALKALS
ncbi:MULTISPECIES: T6SS effector BTH_I2691 family protein, partial [unclassified Pseudomonas]|uniref:T6SS effector BTH_I2691 family protein n=1 Tax=unclassified Pseudomonas TaxID=196821 RepID=UPI0021C5DDC9